MSSNEQAPRRLKIAHLFQGGTMRFYQPQAAQLHMYHTIRGLQQAGHLVSLLALQGRRVLFTDDLEVFRNDKLPDGYFARLGMSGRMAFKLFESAVRRVQTELNLPYLALFDGYRMYDASLKNLQGYDVIHERYNLLAMGGALASRRLGIPFVLEINADLLEQRKFKGNPEKGLRHWFAVWATRLTFKAATKIVCVSAELRDHLHDKWQVEADRLAVLPCAADTEAFAQVNNSRRVRQGLGLKTEPTVMWIGGFYDWHDLDLLVESFTQVVQWLPNAKLILVGDGETRPRIEEKVAQNGLQQAVIMTGALAHEKIPEMISIADVAVAPSPPLAAGRGGTGTPLKLFEYMAAGKAIVATSVNQAAAVIEDGHNGLLVEPGNANLFASTIVSLLQDPAERGRLSRNAQRLAVEKHSWEQYSKQLEAIYRSVLS